LVKRKFAQVLGSQLVKTAGRAKPAGPAFSSGPLSGRL